MFAEGLLPNTFNTPAVAVAVVVITLVERSAHRIRVLRAIERLPVALAECPLTNGIQFD